MFNKLINKNRWLLLLLYLPVYLIQFFVIDNLKLDHHLIVCGIDSLIPFSEYFVIPYAFWFIWFPGVVFLFLFFALKGDDEAKKDFIKLCAVMFSSMQISLIIYLIWPNAIDLREDITADNIFAKAVCLIRLIDTPYGVCPSIHVATIIAEAFVIKDSKAGFANRTFNAAAYIITAFIMYSTMAVKQHSIVDVVLGAALAAALYYLYLIIYRRFYSDREIKTYE